MVTLKKSKTKLTQASIDESIDESFPASDPPAWTTVSRQHKKSSTANTLQDKVTLEWQRTSANFDYETYNRDAKLTFAGGARIQVSNSPVYFGEAKHANSEELMIAALSCCYMQTFLAVASKQGYNVKSYKDEAFGVLGNDEKGKMSMTEVSLNPIIKFEGIQPNDAVLVKIREKAHANCFIANSVNSIIHITIKLIK